MPLTKVDYSKTIIYKIQHKEIDELLYVGSTTDFTRRKAQHKRICNNVNGRTYNSKIYKMIRDNGNFDMFNIIVIKDFPCNNKQEALAEEDRCMREMKSNMNTIRAYVSREEKIEQQKQYRLENKDRIKEEQKQYRLKNKDELREKKKQYRLENRDKVNEMKKRYRLENRDKINERRKQKITCECGCVLTKRVIERHRLTKKHQDFVNTTEQ